MTSMSRATDSVVTSCNDNSTMGGNTMKVRMMVALVAALATLFAITGTAQAAQQNNGWTRLGGDPVVSGGVNTRNEVVQLVTSTKGSTAMMYAGLSYGEQAAVIQAARSGEFRSCSLRYGMRFERMSFGINGTSVDRNVTFLDSRFRSTPAAAWCFDVQAGGKILHLLIPRLCGNFSVINRTQGDHKTTKTTTTTTKKTTKKVSVAYKCVALKKLGQNGQEVILQTVTSQQGVKFVGTKWSLSPSSVIDSRTAKFNVTQNGLVTIVANPVWQVGSTRTVSQKCLIVLTMNQPAATPAPGPTTAQCGPNQTVVNGACQTTAVSTAQSSTTTQSCKEGQTVGKDANGNQICINNSNTNQNSNTNVVPVTVVVNTAPAPCTTCTPTPVVVTPPAAQAPMLSNPTNPEEVFNNGEIYKNVCITASGKNGNSLTLTFGSRYGSWEGGSTITFTSNGVDRICRNYIAPRDQSVVGKSEQFSFNVHDNTSGLNGQEVRGLEFPVKAAPTRP